MLPADSSKWDNPPPEGFNKGAEYMRKKGIWWYSDE